MNGITISYKIIFIFILVIFLSYFILSLAGEYFILFCIYFFYLLLIHRLSGSWLILKFLKLTIFIGVI